MQGLFEGGTFGDYRVVRQLGKGGMAEVWLLKSASGGELAAKILNPSSSSDHESRKRFLREAELAMDVKHPNLVETYDVGEDPDTGLCYILMEYVPGGTLAELIKAIGALPIEDAITVVRSMADVLDLERARGIVHRDIKPENIMFASDGTPKLADLGIARGGLDGNGLESTTVTRADVMIGTPAYMSPEQMLDSHAVDVRADIYSLGVVFFEMLTGERPNKGDTVAQLMAKAVRGVAIADVRSLRPEVSPALAKLVGEMVCPDRDKRLASPKHLAHTLDVLVREGNYKIDIALVRKREKAEQIVRTRASRRRHRRALWSLMMAIAAVSIAGVGIGVWWLMTEDVEMPITPESMPESMSETICVETPTPVEPTTPVETPTPVEPTPVAPTPPVETPAPIEPTPTPVEPTPEPTPTPETPPPSVETPTPSVETPTPPPETPAPTPEPPVLSRAAVEKKLRQGVLEELTLKSGSSICDIVLSVNRETGLNFFVFPEAIGQKMDDMPQITMPNVSVGAALDYVCKVFGCRYVVEDNIILVMPKSRAWKPTPIPNEPLVKAWATKRISLGGSVTNQVMNLDNIIAAIRALGTDEGALRPTNWCVEWSRKNLREYPDLPLRQVHAWRLLDLACQSASMEVQVNKKLNMIRLCAVEKEELARPEEEKSDQPQVPKSVAKKLKSKDGWAAMRETVKVLFKEWRLCERLKEILSESDRKRNPRHLGYLMRCDGQCDVLKAFFMGDSLETKAVVKVKEGGSLQVRVCAPEGTVLIVQDTMLAVGKRRITEAVRYEVPSDDWEDASFDLSCFAGKELRLTLTVLRSSLSSAPMGPIYLSDIRLDLGR